MGSDNVIDDTSDETSEKVCSPQERTRFSSKTILTGLDAARHRTNPLLYKPLMG